jgi:hypothetical protein
LLFVRFETKECKDFANIEEDLWIGHKFRQISGRFNSIEKITVTVKSIAVTGTVSPTTGTAIQGAEKLERLQVHQLQGHVHRIYRNSFTCFGNTILKNFSVYMKRCFVMYSRRNRPASRKVRG